MRTDAHRNPTAFTTELAEQAALVIGVDYEQGAPFQSSGKQYYTAKLLGDPLEITIRVIDKVGFVTRGGMPRWSYVNLFEWLWKGLDRETKINVIGAMYWHEGGLAMRELFPKYGEFR